MKVTDEMVNRFLAWQLPEDFNPDCGISFTKSAHWSSWPTGTNLLTAAQARQMLEHAVGAAPSDELRELRAWREKAFRAHPNLDLDIESLGNDA